MNWDKADQAIKRLDERNLRLRQERIWTDDVRKALQEKLTPRDCLLIAGADRKDDDAEVGRLVRAVLHR